MSYINYEMSCDVLTVLDPCGGGVQVPRNHRLCITASPDVISLFADMAKKISDIIKINEQHLNDVNAALGRERLEHSLEINALKEKIKNLQRRRRSRKGSKK